MAKHIDAPSYCPVDFTADEPARYVPLRSATGQQIEIAGLRERDPKLARTWKMLHRAFVARNGGPNDLVGPVLALPQPRRLPWQGEPVQAYTPSPWLSDRAFRRRNHLSSD